MSPVMAAAAAVVGKLADVRKLTDNDVTPLKASPKLDLIADTVDVESDDDLERLLDIPDDSEATNHSALKPSAGLPKFTVVKGIAAPLDRANVDTDAIIPKQFLKTIKRTGLGSALFYALRFNEDGTENPDFVLNKEPYRHAKILVVTGPNFGCGSSREHAPWALLDAGIICVIAPSYADIFFNNTFKNGMLPLCIPDQPTLLKIAEEAKAGREIEVDLVNQMINDDKGNKLADFEVEEFRKHCLVNGLDDIGLTMQMEDKIRKFEQKMMINSPWIGDPGYLRRGKRTGPVKVEAVPVPTTNRGEEIKEPLDW